MEVKIAEDWRNLLAEEFEQDYFKQLCEFVRNEYSSQTIYPSAKNIFRAFDACSFENLKVVIIGQDPYHGDMQANGLCFSVSEGVSFPPSLQNIFKEICDDLGCQTPKEGDLERWAKQGVLMLNSVLTVRAAQAASHQGKGWESFTDAVVKAIAKEKQGIIYLLWGAYAQRKGAIIDRTKNCVLESVHPSPLSAYRGFMGCKHFSKANEYLISTGKTPIQW